MSSMTCELLQFLSEAPSTGNGDVVVNEDDTFSVTYRLDPSAVWSDGEPITSKDVWFIWQAIIDTEGSISRKGYDLITDINYDDPQVAVITYQQPYAPWCYMFDGLLPEHAFDGNTDISGYWNDMITVSGGPWLQESCDETQHVLVPNENYWMEDRLPLVDRVVMIPKEGSELQTEALDNGEVMTAYPQPFDGFQSMLSDDISFVIGGGPFIEGLWLNQSAPSLQFELTTNIRQALAYSLDRGQIAEAALGSIGDSPDVLQCAGWSPAFGDWCGDGFSRYQQNMGKVTELLTAEGWTRPDPEGLWVNSDGIELVLQWNTVEGNKRREAVQELVVEMTEPFGIGWEVVNYSAAELFQNRLPSMDFGPVALYANGRNPDPSVVSFYDIDGIPSEANDYSGQNHMAYANRMASDLAHQIDEEIDETGRLELVRQLSVILADDVPWIPFYVLPDALMWDASVLEGPGKWISSVYGGFRDIYDWSLKE